MRAALGILAGVFLLFGMFPAAAQDHACKLRCITIYQYFDDEITATILLACDEAAVHCIGDGALRINGEMVPISIAARYLGTKMILKIESARGVLTSGAVIDTMTAAPDGTFSVILGNSSEPQLKTVALRWLILMAPGGSNRRLDQNIGGHLKILIDKYVPAPPSIL